VFSQKPAPGKPQRKGSPVRDDAVTILTSGCHFSGKLFCRGSSRIGGRIEGEIVSEGLLIIEEGAFITAEIVAEEAVIQGHVKGKLRAKGRVELCATSHFEGDISTPSLVINEGAQFNGRSHMTVATPIGKAKGLDSMSDVGASHRPDPELSSKHPEIAIMKSPEVAVGSP